MHHRRFAVAVLFCLFLACCARSPITEPRLSDLEPSVLELTAHVGGTAVGVFSFTNVGTGRLAYSVEAVDDRLSVVSATAGALEPGHEARVVVAAVCEVEGVFAGSVEVLSADAAAGARTLTVNVDCGRAPTEPVNAPPMASFTFDPPSGMAFAPVAVTFDASTSVDADGLIAGYRWDFGDGTRLVTQEPVVEHTFGSHGSYLVTLEVVDEAGATSKESRLFATSVPFTLRVGDAGSGIVTVRNNVTEVRLRLTANPDYEGEITLSCVDAPVTCALSPASVVLSGGGSADVTLSVTVGEDAEPGFSDLVVRASNGAFQAEEVIDLAVSRWTLLGSQGSAVAPRGAGEAQLHAFAFAGDGAPYLLVSETDPVTQRDSVYVVRFVDGAWEVVGGTALDRRFVAQPSADALMVSASGDPVALVGGAFLRWDGSDWEELGRGSGLWSGNAALDSDGRPVALRVVPDGESDALALFKWDDGAWVQVGPSINWDSLGPRIRNHFIRSHPDGSFRVTWEQQDPWRGDWKFPLYEWRDGRWSIRSGAEVNMHAGRSELLGLELDAEGNAYVHWWEVNESFTPPRVLSRIERFGNDFGETTVLDGLPHDADHRVFPDLEGRVFRYLGSASRGPEVAVRVQYFVSSWQCIDPDPCLGVSARNADPATSFMAFDHDNVPYVAWSEQGEVFVAYLPE